LLAIFDLDNTLLAGDSDHAFGEFLCENNLVDVKSYQAKNNAFFQDYCAGKLDIEAYQNFCQKILAQTDLATLDKWQNQFMKEKIYKMILSKAIDLLNEHRRQNHRILIITATNEFIARPIANLLQVNDIIACQCGMKNDRYTGKLVGVASFAAGKITRLNEWLKITGETLENAYFYSDSHNDLPLLKLVDNPVAVDPDTKLLAYAQQHSWKIISLR